MTAKSLMEANMACLFNRRRTKRPSRTAGREGGASVVEVALLVPLVLLPILFAMLNLGRWVVLAIEVSSAAHAGAQFGSLHQANAFNSSGIATAACEDVPEITPCGLSGSALLVAVSNSCYCSGAPPSSGTGSACPVSSCTTGFSVDDLTVTTSGTFNVMFPFPPFTKPLALTSTAIVSVGQY